MLKRKDRGGASVNASSMADIAFLLLIFFLVTTTIQTNKGIALLLPPKPDEDEVKQEIKMNQKNIFKILVNSKDKILVEEEPLDDISLIKDQVKEFVLNFGAPEPEDMELYNSLPPSLKSLVKRDNESSDNPKDAVISFKTDRGTSYEVYILILDELQAAYNEIYGERVGLTAEEFRKLDPSKDERDKVLYERARDRIPRNISIAEPTKIGE